MDIPLPEGEWSISGLIVQGPKSKQPLTPQTFAKAVPRPAITHEVPAAVEAGQPLSVQVQISPGRDVSSVGLHYRPVNQLAKFKTIENAAGRTSFTIPAEDVSPKWDLMYYLEVLNNEGSGWFQPDPHVTTPYYLVKTSAHQRPAPVAK